MFIGIEKGKIYMTKKIKLIFCMAGIIAFASLSFYIGYKMGFKRSESNISHTENQQRTFYAVIQEIDDDYVRVAGAEINDINFRGEFTFTVPDKTKFEWRNTDISVSDLKVGNYISITFSGLVLETYPAQISNITKIQLLDDEISETQLDLNSGALPAYTYRGENQYLVGICRYFTELAVKEEASIAGRAVSAGLKADVVYIPIPVIMKTEDVGNQVFVYGRFWDMWYALDGTSLYCVSGGENAGRITMEQNEDGYRVTGFEKIGDGRAYQEDWKRLCGNDQELYDKFFTEEEQIDHREEVRKDLILQYVEDTGLNIESYQDHGWGPKLLNETDE